MNSIKAGEEMYRQAIKEYKMLQKVKDKISQEEYQIKNSIIGAKFALICEYYLKGLIIPYISIEIPEELKDKIPELTEDEEVLLIVADSPAKIRENSKFRNLSKKELGLLTHHSFKSLGHNLIRLLGTESLDENKPSCLDENIRNNILAGLVIDEKARVECTDFNDRIKQSMNQIRVNEETLSRQEKRSRLVNVIERYIDDVSISEAFPKGRYGMYDGFKVDINFLKFLASTIRQYGVKSVHRNWVEVKDIEDNIGKLIFPDFDSQVKVYEDDSGIPTRTFETVHHFKDSTQISLHQLTGEEVIGRDSYERDCKEPTDYIYFDSLDKLVIEYVQDKKRMKLILEDGIFYEIEFPEDVREI